MKKWKSKVKNSNMWVLEAYCLSLQEKVTCILSICLLQWLHTGKEDRISMKVKKLECPYCGGNLDLSKFNVVNFCPYCGKSVAILEEKTITINKNVKIDETKHTIDRTEIERLKYEFKREQLEKRQNTLLALISAIAALIPLILLILWEWLK